MKTTIFPVICCALLVGATVALPLQGTNHGIVSAASTDGSPAPSPAADQSQTFSGKIISMNDEYFVLRDDANQTWYHLDDQAKAKPFFGKNVAVKGVLDGRTDVIHIRSIEEQQSGQ
jgi:hypothetical protein